LAEERKEISLKFTDVETVKVLKIIADFSGRGLVLPDSNLGVTTVYLSKVPWKEALHAVTTSENLDLEITNNVIVISRKRCGKTAMFTKGKT
jgi:type IV pilus assembly protein PilQ